MIIRAMVLLHGAIAGLLLLAGAELASAGPVFIDDFSVLKNGASFFRDQFDNGVPPPNAPNFSNGTPASYFVFGVLDESSGRVRLDTTQATILPSIVTGQSLFIESGILLPTSIRLT